MGEGNSTTPFLPQFYPGLQTLGYKHSVLTKLELLRVQIFGRRTLLLSGHLIRADFREGDEDSNFSVFRVRRFSEWPGPLH